MTFIKLNLPLKIQGGGCIFLMTQYFFMPQYFERKQADIELSYNMVFKNNCLQKSPGGGEVLYLSHGLNCLYAYVSYNSMNNYFCVNTLILLPIFLAD